MRNPVNFGENLPIILHTKGSRSTNDIVLQENGNVS